METRRKTQGKNRIEQFKSYYVVWKLDFEAVQLWKNTQFKSYYVVWKLGFLILKQKKIQWMKKK